MILSLGEYTSNLEIKSTKEGSGLNFWKTFSILYILIYLIPGMTLNLRELELLVLGVHLLNLLGRGSTQYFDDLDQLICCTLSREEWLSQ